MLPKMNSVANFLGYGPLYKICKNQRSGTLQTYKLSPVVKAQTMLHKQIGVKSLILEDPLKGTAAFCHIYTLL